MVEVRVEECGFCGAKILQYVTTFAGGFSYHIMMEHRNEPKVKRAIELQDEAKMLWDGFRKSRKFIKGKKIETIKKEGLV